MKDEEGESKPVQKQEQKIEGINKRERIDSDEDEEIKKPGDSQQCDEGASEPATPVPDNGSLFDEGDLLFYDFFDRKKTPNKDLKLKYNKIYHPESRLFFCSTCKKKENDSTIIKGEFCKSCMDLNKQLYDIPKEDLINFEGRRCKKIDGKWTCKDIFKGIGIHGDPKGPCIRFLKECKCGEDNNYCQSCTIFNDNEDVVKKYL